MNTGYANPYVVAEASASDRAVFIRKTYLHLAGAIGAFALLEWLLIGLFGKQLEPLIMMMVGSPVSWIAVLVVFGIAGTIADRWARSETSRGMQYLGLGLYIVAQAVIFLPILYLAAVWMGAPEIIVQAGFITGGLVLGLTAVAFVTKQDFSFLRGILAIGIPVALAVIVASLIFSFPLGNLFAGAMVVMMAAAVLYTTSNMIHVYRTEQYVAASLALFASIATMFFWILRILISLAGRD
ncbi:MAG: Bax inhibitor-1 family protein [Verrucomicrobiota bacterium]